LLAYAVNVARQNREFVTPLVTVDLAIFSVIDEKLVVLLVQRPDTPDEPYPKTWALPGGFIDIDKDADLLACARRKLLEKTGVATPYLEQLGAWGGRNRDPRGWSITQVYFSLLPAASVELRAGANAIDVRWVPIEAGASGVSERLAFDHKTLLASALQRLRGKVEYTSLPAFLLPEEFTLSELQRAYEIVLDRPIEKSAFRKRVNDAGLVEPVPRKRLATNRPAQLYRLQGQTPFIFPRTFSPRS
jgi:8-oxo-dGTP diphosphatase